MNQKTLIVGFGSDALSDDGVPLRIIRDLEGTLPEADLQLETRATGGLEVTELLNGFDRAWLIDTIRTKEGKTGDFYLFTPETFSETYHLSSQHDVSFLASLELGKTLGYNMPGKIHIIAIEISDNLTLGMSLTPELEKAYPGILETLIRLINPAQAAV